MGARHGWADRRFGQPKEDGALSTMHDYSQKPYIFNHRPLGATVHATSPAFGGWWPKKSEPPKPEPGKPETPTPKQAAASNRVRNFFIGLSVALGGFIGYEKLTAPPPVTPGQTGLVAPTPHSGPSISALPEGADGVDAPRPVIDLTDDDQKVLYGVVLGLLGVGVVGYGIHRYSEHIRQQRMEALMKILDRQKPKEPEGPPPNPVPNMTLDDVAGIPEVVREIRNLVKLLKAADSHKLGAKLPRGILLKGPPGTGKTLLAKAISGELKCPFIARNGSDFVEVYVGVGASRVRQTFQEARALAGKYGRCIVFIDEIDAVGKQRSAGGMASGGNDEREQTLNAILGEMDGFNEKGADSKVLVIAATNRDELLDDALVRPGRFDRHYTVTPPMTPEGRAAILKVHLKDKKVAADVDALEIARRITPGSTGADIANIANEAACLATLKEREAITRGDFMDAIRTINMGLEREGLVFNEEEKTRTTHHEAVGHAAVAWAQGLEVEAVTVVPRYLDRRGTALGLMRLGTDSMPRFHKTRDYVEKMARVILAGRAAEDSAFGEAKMSSGAYDDLKRVNQLLRAAIEYEGLYRSEFGLATIEPGQPDISPARRAEAEKVLKKVLEQLYSETRLFIQAIPAEAKQAIVEAVKNRETVEGAEEIRALFESPQMLASLQKAGYKGWADLWQKTMAVSDKLAGRVPPKQ